MDYTLESLIQDKNNVLTTDTRDINDLGPVKFRTQADSSIEKKFAIITETKKTGFNSFLAVKKKQRLFLK